MKGNPIALCRPDRIAGWPESVAVRPYRCDEGRLWRRQEDAGPAPYSGLSLPVSASGTTGSAMGRVVPFGQALQSGRFGDGRDRPLEFCRHVYGDNTPLRVIG